MRLVERANEPLIQDNDEIGMTNEEGNANDEVRSNIARSGRFPAAEGA